MMSRPRIYAVDWLRVLVVIVVFFGHIAHIFDVDATGSIKDTETSIAASIYVFFTIQWGIPLLFLLGGLSSWFSLRRRTAGEFVRERAERLLVPLVFGTIVLIPWNGYMNALNKGLYTGSFWGYLPLHLTRTWEWVSSPEVHRGLVVIYYTSWHLWFLGFMLVYSICAVPFFRREARHAWVGALADRWWGLPALALPLAVVRMALGPSFPAYADWADTLTWFALFLYGWLLIQDERPLRTLERQAPAWLACGAATFAAMMAAYPSGALTYWLENPAYTPGYLGFQLLTALNMWVWVLALLAAGLRWLNFDSPFLRYAGEAALPFYMLHQVAVFTIGEAAVRWSIPMAAKASIIIVVAFTATMAVYQLTVRRFTMLQILFGLRSLRSAPLAARRATPSVTT